MIGEVAADIIRKQLYGKEVKDLTEAEKQTISALSQLASGLAVAAGGGNIGDASAAINKDAGKDSQDGKMGNGQKCGFMEREQNISQNMLSSRLKTIHQRL